MEKSNNLTHDVVDNLTSDSSHIENEIEYLYIDNNNAEIGIIDGDILIKNKNNNNVISLSGKDELASYNKLIDLDDNSYQIANTSFVNNNTNYWLNSEFSVKRRIKDKVNEIISINDFGAFGDGVNDDTHAIQNTINYAINNKIRNVYMPAGIYKISDTIILGKSNNFTNIILCGSGSMYKPGFNGTSIVPTFNDRPAIAIQGGRMSGVKDLSIFGVNRDHIFNNKLGCPDCMIDDLNPDTWIGDKLNKSSTNRYSIYAAIAIDPFSGNKPIDGYIDAIYNQPASSNTIIDHTHIEGFAAAVAIQPCDYDGNGDFTTINKCNFSANIYGVTIGNSQSRTVSIQHSTIDRSHTIFSTNIVGKQSGQFGGDINSCAFGLSIYIFHLNGGYPLPKFTSCYTENTYSLGTLVHTSATYSLILDNCNFNLVYPYGDIMAPRGVPLYHIMGDGFITINGGNINTLYGFMCSESMRINTIGSSFRTSMINQNDNLSPDGQQMNKQIKINLKMATLGLIMSPLSNYYSNISCINSWIPFVGSTIISNDIKFINLLGRQTGLPQIASSLYSTGDKDFPRIHIGGNKIRSSQINKNNINISINDTTISFIDPFVDSNMCYPLSIGDLIFDNKGYIFLIISNKNNIVNAIAINGYRNVNNKLYLISEFDTKNGQLVVMNNGGWINSSYLFGDFEKGSDTISNITNYTHQSAIDSIDSNDLNMQVGDYLIWSHNQRCPFKHRIIKIININNNTIQVDQPALFNMYNTPIMLYYTVTQE